MDPNSITGLLHAWRQGDRQAADRVIEIVYDDLRHLAHSLLRDEKHRHTLQPTVLVHELYLRLMRGAQVNWQDRAHLLAISARQMRRILINYARDQRAQKRGSGSTVLSLDAIQGFGSQPRDLLELDTALERLHNLDARAAEVVELRYFGGLTEGETAEVLNISIPTVQRDWRFAKAWLLRDLLGEAKAPDASDPV